jgi:hypothetical protein
MDIEKEKSDRKQGQLGLDRQDEKCDRVIY